MHKEATGLNESGKSPGRSGNIAAGDAVTSYWIRPTLRATLGKTTCDVIFIFAALVSFILITNAKVDNGLIFEKRHLKS